MKKSFRDPVTQVLKAHGFVTTNALGDLSREEPDSFNLEPGKWQWNGTTWVAFVAPPAPPAPTPITDSINAAVGLSPQLKAVLLALASGR